jgi:hypothetical protein
MAPKRVLMYRFFRDAAKSVPGAFAEAAMG